MSKNKALQHLRQDPVLAAVIDQVNIRAISKPALSAFEIACRIMAGQQLSVKAAASIWSRVQELCQPWTPERVAALKPAQLQACGLSRNKAMFMRQLALDLLNQRFDFKRMRRMSDDDAWQALANIKGFGPWSIEMFLISAMQRLDIFSTGDAGLRRAVCQLYGLSHKNYAKRIAIISKQWSPYRSYACRLLWRWLDQQ